MVLKPIKDARDLEGVYVALVTPLMKNDKRNTGNSIDFEKLNMIIDDCIEAGVQGLVPMGTTGQSATVASKGHIAVAKHVIERVKGSKNDVSVIVGAGSNCTRESINLVHEIEKLSPDVALLMVTGYYNCPPQEGVIDHYSLIAERSKLPVVMYNVPSRTSNNISPRTIVKLSNVPGIIGLKQATPFGTGPDPAQSQEWGDLQFILENTDPTKFRVLSGEDGLVSDLLHRGGFGVISATANIPEAARLYAEMHKAARDLDPKKMKELQKKADNYVALVFPNGVKSPIVLHHMFNSPIYLPMASLDRMIAGGNFAAVTAKESIDRAFKSGNLESLKKYH